jgi:hypothetical protein
VLHIHSHYRRSCHWDARLVFDRLSQYLTAHACTVCAAAVASVLPSTYHPSAFHMFSSEDDLWNAYTVGAEDLPQHWGQVHDDGQISLCDDGVNAWPHTLVSPNTFWFFLPCALCPDRPWEHALVLHIHRRMTDGTSLVVHLFSRRSHVEFYGVWTAVQLQPVGETKMLLTLRRHATQPKRPQLVSRTTPPLHVRVHEHHIRCSIPAGWTLHQEECNGPSVIHSRRYNGDILRCDMVLTKGSRRVGVVSIASSLHVTPRQLWRCVHLRDRMRCRVVAVVGTPPELEWLDFGDPECAETYTVHQSLEPLLQQVEGYGDD